MPIVIAQPDMVSPQISTPYGAAEQWSKDFPTLERQQEAISHANLTYAQLQSQAQQAGAALQQHGQIFSAQQQAQQREQQYGGEQAIAQQAYGIQGQLQQQQQHAELAAWVNNQDMTQVENLRLQRLKQAADATMADDTLSYTDKMNLVGQLRAGIEPLQARQQLTQQKAEKLKEAADLRAEHKANILEAAKKAFDAQTTDQKTSTIYNPATIEELGRQYDEANPGIEAMASMVPGGKEMAAANKKKVVEAMAAQHPDGVLGHRIVMEATGKHDIQWKKDETEKTDAANLAQDKAFQEAQKHYDKLHSDAVARIDKLQAQREKDKPGSVPENEKTRDWVMENAKADLAAKDIHPPKAPERIKGKHEEWKARGNPFMTKKENDRAGGAATGEQPAPAVPKPTEGAAKEIATNPPFTDRTKATPNQEKLLADVSTFVRAAHQSNIPVQQKVQFTQAGDQVHQLLREYGSAQAMQAEAHDSKKSAEERDKAARSYALYHNALNFLKHVPEPTPAPASPVQAPIGTAAGPDPRSSIYMRQR